MTDTPWMDFAWQELGVRETPGPGNNPRVLEYHAATTLHATEDEVAWCSSFANWCMAKAMRPGSKSASARSWLSWGEPIVARPGAITVLERGTNPAQGHVGFLVHATADKVWLLGGNQGDSVSVQSFPSSRVLGMRWPV